MGRWTRVHAQATGGGTAILATPLPQYVTELPDLLASPLTGTQLSIPIAANSHDFGLGLAGVTTTPTWGYGGATYLGPTIVAQSGTPINIDWINNLTGNINAHLLPVDTTIHWAHPSSGIPVVTHLHGGKNLSLSDGLPDAWVTNTGQRGRLAQPATTGSGNSLTYKYPNEQEAATIWYHDHALGITRLNVYAGLAAFYIIRDAFDTGAPDNPLGLPTSPYEQLIVIQDKLFTTIGELFYPASNADLALLAPNAPVFPGNAPYPSVLPEFFGNTIVVNGVAWPKMTVEPRLYRLRLLNGCDTRFLNLFFNGNLVQMYQIGTDQGLLNAPVPVKAVTIAPGERADLLVDFTRAVGRNVTLQNNAPGTFKRPIVVDPKTTGQIMQFQVGATVGNTTNNLVPVTLRPPASPTITIPPTPTQPPRQLALFEWLPLNQNPPEYGRLTPLLGTVADGAILWEGNLPETMTFVGTEITGGGLYYTENPRAGSIETWEIYNTTVDNHPIHLHLVRFQILDRQKFTATQLTPISPLTNIKFQGKAIPPAPEEAGWKDTVICPPGQVTRIVVKFELPSEETTPAEYVWHCHILSHEDNEMMRPFVVEP
ncbi:multicopper oxidase family protein [Gloeothece citriformis]|uniref:multicopper oxidase family protein n=1 Tax=Gloeothece citriformis TaxID=2546356 RepID=UPI001389A722|nr:multicopper oxidase [Gloeothece citriformis]